MTKCVDRGDSNKKSSTVASSPSGSIVFLSAAGLGPEPARDWYSIIMNRREGFG